MASAGRILILPKGEYNSSTTYEMLDLVNHNGKSWLAKKTSVGIEPSDANSEYWQDMFDINADTFGALSKKGGTLSGDTTIQKDIPRLTLKVSENRESLIHKNASRTVDTGTAIIDKSEIDGHVVRTILAIQNGVVRLHKQVDGVEVGSKIIAEIT